MFLHLESVATLREIVEEARAVIQIILWYLDSGCSKHMTVDRSRLRNFMKQFIRIVRFRNDHFGAIMGYEDYVIGDNVIFRENGVVLDEMQLLFIAGGHDNAIDEDVDESPAPTALTMFMENLSSTYLVYDKAGPSYDSNILSEVHDHDNYQDAICELHEVHEMLDNVQPNCVVDSNAEYMSDSNMIPYDQEQVELYERRAKFELTEREQKIEKQLRSVITYRNLKEENLKKKLHSTKMQLNSTINHNKSMVQEVTSLKKNFQQKENKYLEEFLDMRALKEKVEDKLFKPDQSLQTVHILCKPKSYYDEQRMVAIGYKNPLHRTHAKQVQPALYNGHEILKSHHVPTIVHNSDDTLEIAEITRKKINDKMKTPLWTEQNINIRPPDYSKENYLATFTPHTQLTPEQIFWSKDAFTKEMKEFFKELEAEVDHNAVNKKCNEIERKNLLLANDNLIVDFLSKEVFYIATNSELTISRFSKMHDAHTVVQARCLELKAELSKLNDKIKKDDHNELIKCFSILEVVQIILWYLDSGCSKHITVDRSRLRNFIKQFIRTVRFRNDHFGAIMGYEDYVIGDNVIFRVYYVEGLGHNLFSVG
nr:integrase, catalytic region, zinc finger, CCHC-type, peptidase aspartic, catalytic [Tanacetum cinerariifolium]